MFLPKILLATQLVLFTLAPVPSQAERQVGDFVMVGKTKFTIWGGVSTGIMPKGASTSPDNKWLFVSNFGRKGRQNISVYHANPMTFHKYINYAGNSIESVVSPDSSTLYSSNMYGHYLDIIDLKAMAWMSRIKVKGFPKVILLNRDGSLAYLSLWEDRAFARFNTRTQVVEYFRTGQVNPRGLALNQDETSLYIANNGSANYSIVDVKNLAAGTPPTLRNLLLAKGPRHAVVSRDGKRLYISVMSTDVIKVIDTATEKVIQTIVVGSKPKTIIESTDGKFLYTANYTGHSMSIIDTATWETKELPLDIVRASGITARQDDQFIYVTGWCTDDVWAVQRIDPGQSPQTPLGAGFRRKVCRDCERDKMGCDLIK